MAKSKGPRIDPWGTPERKTSKGSTDTSVFSVKYTADKNVLRSSKKKEHFLMSTLMFW